ncbi:MAG: type I restriction enzyme HsdR N-terminal domain-containing protein [Bacteroidota bacterium]
MKGNNMTKTYWQVMAGSYGREYSKYFLKYGIAFVGGIKQEAEILKTKVGDIIVLKKGRSEIIAAGEIVERNGCHNGNVKAGKHRDKEWLRDIDGWDLPGFCYVDWYESSDNKQDNSPPVGLTRRTICGIDKKEIQDQADDILSRGVKRKKEDEPKLFNSIKEDMLIMTILNKLPKNTTEQRVKYEFKQITKLAQYYIEEGEKNERCKDRGINWGDIREHEVRTFLVIPLLLALGWKKENLKIELPCKVDKGHGKIDIACFNSSYTSGSNDLKLIIETKGFGSGLDYALNQAKQYAKAYQNCKTLVVSNGYSFKSYKENRADFTPHAYLNLLKPTDKYPLDTSVGGGTELLEDLLP